ncbi:MAG: double-strand break repair protein AddB [Rickettsiales bacterium]|jgi:ATP-dependent helicase/nuclease subunit B|nr:double-strand break repair protein AddB [Rickettsiales bacterium]
MKHVFNIPLSRPFLASLARWMAATGGEGMPEDLVLLPTRRACRALKEAFADIGGAALLPKIMPLGDMDEDGFAFLEYEGEGSLDAPLPPAMPAVERNLLLAELIIGKSPGMRHDQAFRLAGDLARLIDTVEMEELDFGRLDGLVPERYSEYWRQTLEFLKIVADAYPAILAERGYMDPVARKIALIRRQAEAWRKYPPHGRVIAAGSTGSLVPVARLLADIAGMEKGFVVLPGLDRWMSEGDWAKCGQNHPQYGLRNLIAKMGLSRASIPDLPDYGNTANQPGLASGRERLASCIMLDSAMDYDYRRLPDFQPGTMRGLSIITLRNEREEARALSIVVRGAVERGQTVRLVTPSRSLAKSVAGELLRWNIAADDSRGVQGSETDLGNYMLVALNAVTEDFSPYSLLALLRHEYTHAGYAKAELEALAGSLERRILRGSIEMRGMEGIRARLAELKSSGAEIDFRGLEGLLDRMKSISGGFGKYFYADGRIPLADLVGAHVEMVEGFVRNDRNQPGFAENLLYSGDMDSQVAAELGQLLSALEKLRGDSLGIGAMPAEAYAGFISGWLFGLSVRPTASLNPRVAIENSIEARLLEADLFVMAGLNEGTFPTVAADDPWMGRPMRSSFGLPLPERKIGLSSHDFAEFFSKPNVVITRALKEGGVNTIASRWLQKLDAILGISGLPLDAGYADYVTDVARRLDVPERVEKASRPAPRPPVAARPRELWATHVEAWYRDPYVIYAGRILKLKKLDEIEREAGPADFGNIVHKSLEQFKTAGFSSYSDLVAAMFRNAAPYAGIAKIDFWYAKFKSIAKWFVDYEESRKALISATYVEAEGALEISDGFILRAKADRIDVLKSGGAVVSDYKTGTAPSKREIGEGYAPQLPLEALILERGGFKGVKGVVEELRFLELGKDKATVYSREKDGLETLLERTLGKLYETVKKFDDPSTPYLSRPNPSKVGAAIEEYSDYTHLARVKEWRG